MESLLLTLLIFLPVLGAISMLPVSMILGKEGGVYYKWIALTATGIQFFLCLIPYGYLPRMYMI